MGGPGAVPVSWLMLTSSCLSRGAQGYMVENRGLGSDSMHYANFELGVVFASKLTGGEDDVLYVMKGGMGRDDGIGEHEDAKMGAGLRVVSLPVPYDLNRSKKYCVEDGDPDENNYEGGVFRYIPHMNTHEVRRGEQENKNAGVRLGARHTYTRAQSPCFLRDYECTASARACCLCPHRNRRARYSWLAGAGSTTGRPSAGLMRASTRRSGLRLRACQGKKYGSKM